MVIKFYCPCSQKLSAEDSHVGKKVRCPKCHRLLVTPNLLLDHTEMKETPDDEADTRTFESHT